MKIKHLKGEKVSSFLKKEWDKENKRRKIVWKEEELTICALEKNEVIGCSKFKINGGVCYISEVIIKQDVRGNGVGRKLLIATENIAKQKGCHKMQLYTSRLNGNALEFYLKNKYNIEAKLKDDKFHIEKFILMKRIK